MSSDNQQAGISSASLPVNNERIALITGITGQVIIYTYGDDSPNCSIVSTSMCCFRMDPIWPNFFLRKATRCTVLFGVQALLTLPASSICMQIHILIRRVK